MFILIWRCRQSFHSALWNSASISFIHLLLRGRELGNTAYDRVSFFVTVEPKGIVGYPFYTENSGPLLPHSLLPVPTRTLFAYLLPGPTEQTHFSAAVAAAPAPCVVKENRFSYGKRRTVHEWFSTTCACYTDGNIWILLFGCLRPNERMVLQRVLLPWVKARRSAGRGGFRVEPTNVEHVFDVSEALPVPGGFSFFTKNHLITLPCLLKPRLQLVELETFVPGCGVASNNYKTSNQYVFKFLLLFLSGPRFGDVFCLKLFFFFKPTCVIISPTEKEKLVHRVKRFVVRIFHLRMSFL